MPDADRIELGIDALLLWNVMRFCEKKELLTQIKVQNLICYNYKILTDHKPHPQSPLSQAARRSWQTSSHPSPCSRANPG